MMMNQGTGNMGQQNMGQQNMAKKKISLTTGFANAINLPRHTAPDGDSPLYPHGVDSKVPSKHTQSWFKAAESTYNSPSNTRVVCLCNDGANVLYWSSPVKGGRLSNQLEAACAYVFDKSAKGGQRINTQQYTWENAGLYALVSPVVLSNIEELWISADLLACPQYAQYYNQLCGLKQGHVAGVDFLTDIVENEISIPTKPRTIADTFPLLRAIVVVKTPPNAQVQDFHKCAVRTDEVKKILETRFPTQRRAVGETKEIMTQIARMTGFGFAVQPIMTGDILKFSLGDYKYSQKVLAGVRDKLIQKYTPKAPETAVKPVETQRVVEPVATQKVVEPVTKAEATSKTEVGSLASIIYDLESQYDFTLICKTLFAYKLAKPTFFKEQVPHLPAALRKKYEAVFIN